MDGKLKVGGSMGNKYILKGKMKQRWRKIEKYTARKSVRNRYCLVRGKERCFEIFEEIAKNKMRKNHKSVCPLILVFLFEIQK